MKKRIIALVLTVVMSLLTLSSCGSFDFVEEDLSAYATFNYGDFKTALANIEIEDGEFTTNEETRKALVAAKIYNAVADKIIAETDEDEWVKTGKLTAGDVLYFVYYAEDADGNMFFGSEMNKTSITTSSTKANHTLKLGDYLDAEDDKFLTLVKENLADVELDDYIQTPANAADLEGDELKVKAGDAIFISYTRTYKKVVEGAETEVKESAAYEPILLDAENAFHKFFLDADSVAKVGSDLEVLDSKDAEGKVTTKKTFEVTEDGVTYTYSNVKILWKLETVGEPIATFKHTPYTADKKVTPDSLTSTSAEQVNLKDVELTYYVFPVYAIDAPSYEEITAEDVLYYVYGSKLVSTSFEVLGEDGYVNGEEKVADLLKEIADIFNTTSKDNKYYADGTELKTLLDKYNEVGGDKPTNDQKTANTEAKEALTDKQNETLKGVIAKIAAATKGEDKLSQKVLDEYYENNYHSLKEEYDSDIIEKVQTAVWKLIDTHVKLTGEYPEKLLKEYIDHLYEYYEYQYHKGSSGSGSTAVNYIDKYDSLKAFLISKDALNVADESKIDEALEKEAKSYLDPIIKIYVVAKACKDDAVAAMSGENGYVELDIKGGAYHVNEEAYRETYGDAADKKIEEAKKSADENIKAARDEAGVFIIDDAFMKSYKKEIGRAYYNDLIKDYGEINLRAGFQFNKLFYYLTSTNIQLNEDGDHTEASYKDVDGVKYIDFRTVTYTIKADAE